MSDKKILDVTCGSRTIWFNKHHPAAVYCDKRKEEYHKLWKNAGNCTLNIAPDIQCDFTNLPFDDECFSLVVFDPPHLLNVGDQSWLAKKYGKLNKKTWKQDISKGFDECMRVLKPCGVLIFKWNEQQIKMQDILLAVNYKPLFGNKRAKTHWLVFNKQKREEKENVPKV